MGEKLDLSQLITPAEAARVCGRTRQAIYRLIEVGKLTSVNVGGRDFVYRQQIETFEFSKAGRPAKKAARKSAKGSKKALP
jgi:excisionase family DNA binding protein